MAAHGSRKLFQLNTWLTAAGLVGKSETVLLDVFCWFALDADLPIARAVIMIDTLHPVHEGRAFFWRREGGQAQIELAGMIGCLHWPPISSTGRSI
jgi:adenylate cyclase